MRPTAVRFSAQARRRQIEAYDWYKERSAETAERFLVAVQGATAQLLRFPRSGRRGKGEIRHKRVGGYPYALLYRVRREDILVLTVAHMRLHPKRWLLKAD